VIESDKLAPINAEHAFPVYKRVVDPGHFASRQILGDTDEADVWRVYHGDSQYPTLIAETTRAKLGEARIWQVQCSHCPPFPTRMVTVEL
jgi:hypothetical protein